MEIEVFVTKILHTIGTNEFERASSLKNAFEAADTETIRIRIIQLTVLYCEYVMHKNTYSSMLF